MKSGKKLNFFLIFFVQDVARDIQKCMLKGFLKNINSILNKPYPYVLKLKLPASFSSKPKSAEFMDTWKLNFAPKHPKVWWDLTGCPWIFRYIWLILCHKETSSWSNQFDKWSDSVTRQKWLIFTNQLRKAKIQHYLAQNGHIWWPLYFIKLLILHIIL